MKFDEFCEAVKEEYAKRFRKILRYTGKISKGRFVEWKNPQRAFKTCCGQINKVNEDLAEYQNSVGYFLYGKIIKDKRSKR